MGIFGRSRANTTNQISQPVFTYSDAAPREDLQSVLAVDSPRLRTAKPGRASNQNGKGHLQPHQHIAQQFDFTVTEPPGTPAGSELSPLNDARADANAIGIALGSPSMAPPPPQYHSNEMNLSRPDFSETASEKASEKEVTIRTDSLRRKPSKWKKLGVLLKASRQLEMKQTREGLYQLDMNRSQVESVSGSQRHLTQTCHKQKEDAKKSSQRRGDKGDIHQTSAGGALLKVDIPTVQMERYSVMFRSVLGEKPPSSLLARRSKALDQLHVQPPLPEAYKPQRRGTSPGSSRAPAVSYKDTNKNDDKTNNGFKSPVRANTFPRAAALSKFNNSHLAVPNLTTALSTGTSLDEYSSAESSPIPFDSPISTRNHIDGEKPSPVWEMVTKNPSSMPPATSYKVISADSSARSTPVTTPLVGTDATTSPKIKSLPLLRKEFLPPSSDHTVKTKTVAAVSTNEIKQQPEDQEQDNDEEDEVLLIQRPDDDHPPKISSAQTMPLPLNINTNKHQTQTQTQNPKTSTTSMTTPTTDPDEPQFPQTIEISIARSVSVARRVPKQTLVPLGASPEVFHDANERFGEHQKLLPTLVNVSKYGGGHHRPKSQDIVIETL